MAEFPKKITDDPYGAAILIRRLVMEQGIVYWRRYLTAFLLMGVAAGATAGSAYILGQVINQAYVDKNVHGIVALSGVTLLLFMIKGASTYGHTVILSKISNAILANNQRRLFAKLMSESIGFYSERHSSEFLARLTAGAKSITDVLNLLINAIGRDLLMLISCSRSRPIALNSRFSESAMDFAPALSRARNSDECRSEKKPMLSFISLANSRRWLLARIAFEIFDRIVVWP